MSKAVLKSLSVAAGNFQNAIDSAYYKMQLSQAVTALLASLEMIDANTVTLRNNDATQEKDRAWADAQTDYFERQADAQIDRDNAAVTDSVTLINGGTSAAVIDANSEVTLGATLDTAEEDALHSVNSASISADYAWSNGEIGIQSLWNASDMGATAALRSTVTAAHATAKNAYRAATSTFLTNDSQRRLTQITTAVNGMVGQQTTSLMYTGSTPTTSTIVLTRQQADFVITEATADNTYIGSTAIAGNTFDATIQTANDTLWNSYWGSVDSIRNAEFSASTTYQAALASYNHTVNTTIETATHDFVNTRIMSDSLRTRSTNVSLGNASNSLVAAEAHSMRSINGATRAWAHGIGDAYKQEFGGAYGNATTDSLLNSLLNGNKVTNTTIQQLKTEQQTNPQQPSQRTPGQIQNLQIPFTAVDALFDQANTNAETQRVNDVINAKNTLGSSLEAADTAWGNTMTAAGNALGAAIDGIQDFNWQHIRDYVGTIAGAQRASDIATLNAQIAFLTSYYSSLNTYASSLASSGVTLATSYGLAIAEFYVNTAEAQANAAEVAGASNAGDLRNRATAFSAFAGQYVNHTASIAGTAANDAMSGLINENANNLAVTISDANTVETTINNQFDALLASIQNAPSKPVVDSEGNPIPSATEQITTLLNTAKSNLANARSERTDKLSPLTEPRPTVTPHSFNALTSSVHNVGSNAPANGSPRYDENGLLHLLEPEGPQPANDIPRIHVPRTINVDVEDQPQDDTNQLITRYNELLTQGLAATGEISQEAFDKLRAEGGGFSYGDLIEGGHQYVIKTTQGWHVFIYHRKFVPKVALYPHHTPQYVEIPGHYEHRFLSTPDITSKAAREVAWLEQKSNSKAIVAAGLTFALHLVPMGTLADAVATGEGTDTTSGKIIVAITTVADVAPLIGKAGMAILKTADSAADVAKGIRLVKIATKVSLAANVAGAGMDAYLVVTDEDGRAANSASFLLRLAMIGLDAKQLKELQQIEAKLFKAPITSDLHYSKNGLPIYVKEGCFIAGTEVVLSGVSQRKQKSLTLHGESVTGFDWGATHEQIRLPIEEVAIGSRVATRNPNRDDYDDSLGEPDSSWKLVAMRFTRKNGSPVEVELLRPLEWIRHHHLEPGGSVFLTNAELEVRGAGHVISIGECPPIAEGDGAVVIGRFKSHFAGSLVRLSFEGGETLTGTANHPIWSVERQGWVGLGDLNPGDHVQGGESILQLIEVSPLDELLPVYNLEVHGEHVYEVTNARILVHNNDLWCELLELQAQQKNGTLGDKAGRLAELEQMVIQGKLVAPRTISVDLPGDFPNGAKIHLNGNEATIHVLGVDTADDLAAIFRAARQNGASRGSLFTGKVVNDIELARYLDLAKRG